MICTVESAFGNSRTEPLHYPAFKHEGRIDIMRDDLIHPVVCGNKWRKLRYIIQHLQSNHFSKLVTFGGAYSNHLAAAAFAGKIFGIETHAFVRGDEDRPLNNYETLCLKQGMQINHVSRSAYRDKEQLFNEAFGNDPKAFFLDEGGNHPLALKGCAEMVDEWTRPYDYVVLPVGTGTTMEGLVQGVLKHGYQTSIIGISTLKNNHALDKRLLPYPASSWQILHDYHRGKYGAVDDELIQYCKEFHALTGVLLDPVYTGKMMMAAEDLLQKNFFEPNASVLFIHTGGLLSAVH